MSFRKLFNMSAYGAFALARKNPKKGEPYSLKNIAKQAKLKLESPPPLQRKVEEKKKKKSTNDIKIDKDSGSKKKKGKSDKADTSGPGDANL
jgi:hypothetical protein